MTAIIHLIMTHPRVYAKIITTLEDRIQDESHLGYEDVKDIPYLDATIDEG